MLFINLFSLTFLSSLFFYMWKVGRRQGLTQVIGWTTIHAGVGTMVLTNLIDLPRHLAPFVAALNQLPPFLTKVVAGGYVAGFALVVVGGARWLPLIIERQKELALRTANRRAALSEDKYRKLFEDSFDAIFIQDMDGRLVDFNRGALALSGRRYAELAAMTFQQLHPAPESEGAQLCMRELTSQPQVQIESLLKRSDGEVIEISISAQLIDEEQGLIQCIVRDITTQKRAQENLEASHSRLEQVVEQRTAELAAEQERLATTLGSISEGVVTLDLEGRIIYMNKTAAEMTGWDFQEVALQDVGKTISLAPLAGGAGEPFQYERARAEVTEAASVTHTVRLVSRTGEVHLVRYISTPLRGPESRLAGIVLVFRDISHEEQLEAERQKGQKLESLGILAGGLAHDFNNFLMSIMLNVANARYKADDKGIIHYLSEAEKSIERAKSITQQLLTFARGGEPIRSDLLLGPIIRESVNFALTGSNVTSAIDLELDLAVVSADSGQINQVLNNLIINAASAMPKGGSIQVKARNMEIKQGQLPIDLSPGHYVEVSVEDAGIGISADIIDSIFDPYFTTKDAGSGLGLTSCYSILRQHEGGITVSSEMGVGSIFTFYLPAIRKLGPEGVKPAAQILAGSGKILIMDDDEAIRSSLANLLESLGYDVKAAADGEAAESLYRQARENGNGFNLVILDLTIPGGRGGLETLQELQKMNPEVVAVVSSGYATNPVMAQFEAYGFSGALPKPFRPEVLSKVIRELLEGGD